MQDSADQSEEEKGLSPFLPPSLPPSLPPFLPSALPFRTGTRCQHDWPRLPETPHPLPLLHHHPPSLPPFLPPFLLSFPEENVLKVSKPMGAKEGQ